MRCRCSRKTSHLWPVGKLGTEDGKEVDQWDRASVTILAVPAAHPSSTELAGSPTLRTARKLSLDYPHDSRYAQAG